MVFACHFSFLASWIAFLHVLTMRARISFLTEDEVSFSLRTHVYLWWFLSNHWSDLCDFLRFLQFSCFGRKYFWDTLWRTVYNILLFLYLFPFLFSWYQIIMVEFFLYFFKTHNWIHLIFFLSFVCSWSETHAMRRLRIAKWISLSDEIVSWITHIFGLISWVHMANWILLLLNTFMSSMYFLLVQSLKASIPSRWFRTMWLLDCLRTCCSFIDFFSCSKQVL